MDDDDNDAAEAEDEVGPDDEGSDGIERGEMTGAAALPSRLPCTIGQARASHSTGGGAKRERRGRVPKCSGRQPKGRCARAWRTRQCRRSRRCGPGPPSARSPCVRPTHVNICIIIIIIIMRKSKTRAGYLRESLTAFLGRWTISAVHPRRSTSHLSLAAKIFARKIEE